MPRRCSPAALIRRAPACNEEGQELAGRMMSKGAAKLTAKQQRFVDEYLIDLNATAAYRRAGYAAKGNSAEVNAARMLRNAQVQSFLTERMQAREKRTEITQDRVLQEYAKLAFLDPRRFYDANGALIPVQNLPEDVAAALSGMDVVMERAGEDKDGNPAYADVKKIKFVDKKGALDSVARHLGMFNDKVQHSGPDGGPIQIQRIERVIVDPK